MRKKVLLMGKSGAGKSSMRSIIFANYIARDTRRLGATIDVEHSHVRFLGHLTLNIWDAGGQEAFMENYLQSQREHIFRHVEVLIYVFDVESREQDSDLHYFQSVLEAILALSPEAKIFCLVHKMDLLEESERAIVFQEREAELKKRSLPLQVTCFATSIWDESLYKAWSAIVYALVPNIEALGHYLKAFAESCQAQEAVLFERATFLVVHATKTDSNDVTDSPLSSHSNWDPHRHEKISNMIKQFKLSCSKSQTGFASMQVALSNGSQIHLLPLTANTMVLLVLKQTCLALVKNHVQAVSSLFESLEK